MENRVHVLDVQLFNDVLTGVLEMRQVQMPESNVLSQEFFWGSVLFNPTTETKFLPIWFREWLVPWSSKCLGSPVYKLAAEKRSYIPPNLGKLPSTALLFKTKQIKGNQWNSDWMGTARFLLGGAGEPAGSKLWETKQCIPQFRRSKALRREVFVGEAQKACRSHNNFWKRLH